MANEGPRKPAAVIPKLVWWKPLSPGQYKVNTDDAMFSNQRKVGLGVMIRNSTKSVIAALSSPMVGSLGALKTEAKAMEIGMRFAQDVGIWDVVFENDSLEVYNAVKGTMTLSSSIHFIVDGIHQQACMFKSCSFSDTERQGNVYTHMLAQYSKSLISYIACDRPKTNWPLVIN